MNEPVFLGQKGRFTIFTPCNSTNYQMTAQKVIEILKLQRFLIVSEMQLQSAMQEVFNNLGIIHKRSFLLDKDGESIIDFLVNGNIGIEVKIKGNRSDIYKQVVRYCQYNKIITSMILVTSKTMGLPVKISGIPCYVINLNKAWL